jgi:hypothetical protein
MEKGKGEKIKDRLEAGGERFKRMGSRVRGKRENGKGKK